MKTNTFKVITTIKLHDECKNGTCSWSITGILQQKKGNGRFYDIGHGCIHEEILKASPKLKMFVDLHLLYPKDKKQAKEFLAKCEDKDYFKYQLFALGIVERWQEESRKAIQTTGDVWVNPYKESEEREEIEGKILSGYYTESAIQERQEAKRIAEIITCLKI